MAALMADYNGITKAAHVRDKLVQLVMYLETVRGLTKAAALECRYRQGIAVPNVVYTNAAKYHFADRYHEMAKLVQDIAGGLVVTAPMEEDWQNPETRRDMERYLGGSASATAEQRLRAINLVRDVTASDLGGYLELLAIHAEGSLETQKLTILMDADLTPYYEYAKQLAGIASPSESACAVQQLFDLSGRVALVTGGSRGLGLEMAEGLGEAGAKVVVTARREQWLTSAAETLSAAGIDALALPCDITDPAQVETLCETVVGRFGAIDILVNNAGVAWNAPAEDMPLDKWRQVIDTNLTGTFVVTQVVGRTMIARRSGKVINTASIAGLVGEPPEVLDAIGYSAAKGGVIAFTRDLAVKWARHGITVNAIAPGFFPTRMTEDVLERSSREIEARTPLGRVGKPGELKGVAVFLASAASDYITGQVIAVDGGATAE